MLVAWLVAILVFGGISAAFGPRQSGKTVSGGSGPDLLYLHPVTRQPMRMTSDITAFQETCFTVHVGTRLRVRLFESAVTLTEGEAAQLVTHETAMADVRDACNRRCQAINDPGAAALFDEALAATGTPFRPGAGTKITGGEAASTYPWRYVLAAISLVAIVIFILGLPLSLFLMGILPRLRAALPLDRCGHCGYTRAGLAAHTLCPECGLSSPTSSTAPPIA